MDKLAVHSNGFYHPQFIMTQLSDKSFVHESLRNSRVLVIGASSFIGMHLVRQLSEYGAVVHATYRSDRPIFPVDVSVEYLDITDLEAIKNRLRHFQPDYIFNMAAFVNGSRNLNMVIPTMKANLEGNLNLLLATVEIPVKRLVLIGSMDERQELTQHDATPPSPYAASKMASSAYAKMFHQLYELPVAIARVYMAYGPGQKDLQKLIPYTITSLMKGDHPDFGTGLRMVDWIYISDVIDGLIRVMLGPGLDGETVCIGTGKLVSVREVILSIFRHMKTGESPNFGILPDRPLETSVAALVERTQQQIGWQPKVDIESGISQTVKWYRQNYHPSSVINPAA